MVKYKFSINYGDVDIDIILQGATPSEAETYLRNNYGAYTINQLVDWFKANVGPPETDFEITCP